MRARRCSRITANVGMKRDGTVTAIAGDWLIDTGYYSMTTQAQVAVGCGEAQLVVREARLRPAPHLAGQACFDERTILVAERFAGWHRFAKVGLSIYLGQQVPLELP